MSRPFSYNDENFTVIGNMLFVHIKVTKPVEAGQNFIEIPAGIANRLVYYSNIFYTLSSSLGSANAETTSGGIRYLKGRYYIVMSTPIDPSSTNYLSTYYWLKDI